MLRSERCQKSPTIVVRKWNAVRVNFYLQKYWNRVGNTDCFCDGYVIHILAKTFYKLNKRMKWCSFCANTFIFVVVSSKIASYWCVYCKHGFPLYNIVKVNSCYIVTKNCLVSICSPNEMLWIGYSFKPGSNEKPCQLKTLGLLFILNTNKASFALNRVAGEFKSHKNWEKLTKYVRLRENMVHISNSLWDELRMIKKAFSLF